MYTQTLAIANETSKYFLAKYRDRDASIKLSCDRCWGTHTVNRPNHGLCHSVRQGLLAIKIAQTINLECDLYKLQAAASFQRSGRQSEISSSKDPVLYQSYEDQDVKNFLLFVDDHEYASAIHWSSETEIAKVLHAAHHLDLRRIPSFDEGIIRKNVMELLPVTEDQLNELWAYSGRLLHASGDRCMCCGKSKYSPIFARLSNRPQDLVQTLIKVK
jgi:hypothetical protein